MLRHCHKSRHGFGLTCNRNNTCNDFKIWAYPVDCFKSNR